jgi:hypothetical protein
LPRPQPAQDIVSAAAVCGVVSICFAFEGDLMNTLNGYDFEDLAIGMSASFTKTISEEDIVLFAGVSGDTNAVHVDEDFARTTVFKGRIAHGMLSASVISAAMAGRPVHRRPGPLQLRGHQPGVHPDRSRHQGRKHHPGHQEPHRRHGEGPHLHDRRLAFEIGRNLATHARFGGLRERADPADPVRAAHRKGLQDARC